MRLIDADEFEKRIKPYDTEDGMDKALYNFAHYYLVTTPSARPEDRCGECDAWNQYKNYPSAEPTLHGYNIEHLELIARVLQKENLPPERIAEALTDIGRIVAIVRDEFEETLRKAVEQCTI